MALLRLRPRGSRPSKSSLTSPSTKTRQLFRRGPELHHRQVTCERFVDEYVLCHLKPSTAGENKRCVDIFINPEIGTMKLVSVERSDFAKIHHQLRHIPYQANRVLSVLSIMFSLAESRSLHPLNNNPCRGVKKYKEKKRERFLSREELRRLGEALRIDEEFTPSTVNCIRLHCSPAVASGKSRPSSGHIRTWTLIWPSSQILRRVGKRLISARSPSSCSTASRVAGTNFMSSRETSKASI